MIKKISFTLSTLLGVGRIPFAPGTWGSFVSVLLAIPIIYFLGLKGLIIFTIIGFIVGYLATCGTLKYTEHDPSFVVIDEMVGQWLTFCFVTVSLYQIPLVGGVFIYSSWWIYLLGFFLFRFFDILKPYPIKYADSHINNSFGVMFDDILAGIYAGIVLFIVVTFII